MLKDSLSLKVDSLKPAFVTAKIRPRIKGDTIEYSTDKMKLKRNANVEDLLSRLPGLRVYPDGTIMYNGKKIQQLLVDGEDIFGSDPSIVTKSFDGSKIAKIQVLDNKTDQALFTGVHDGTSIKTINLVLNDESRNGYFGKLEAGSNFKNYNTADCMVAGFRKQEQFTMLGISSNTGLINLTNTEGSSAPSIFLNAVTSDALGASAGRGIPNVEALATHYANKWSNDEDHIAGNIQYIHFATRPITSTFSQQLLSNSVYIQNDVNRSINSQSQRWGHFLYDWSPNNTSSFKLSFSGLKTSGQNDLVSNQSSTLGDSLVNSSIRKISDHLQNQTAGGDLAWQRKFGNDSKQVVSLAAGVNSSNNSTAGYLTDHTTYFNNGNAAAIDSVDQRKELTDKTISVTTSVAYVQPLASKTTLGLAYRLNLTDDQPFQGTFDRGQGKYITPVDSLTTRYKTRLMMQSLSLLLQGTIKNVTYELANDFTSYTSSQNDLERFSKIHQHYFNWNPRFAATLELNPRSLLIANYQTSTQFPSPAELAPAKNNNDPLHQIIGNPNLNPASTQIVDLEFRHTGDWILGATLNVSFTKDATTSSTTTDSIGRQITQDINIDGNKSGWFDFSLDRNLMGIDFGSRTFGAYSQINTIVNSNISRNYLESAGEEISARKYSAGNYEFRLSTTVTKIYSDATINSQNSISYYSGNQSASLAFLLIPGFDFSSTIVHSWQSRPNALSTATSTTYLNAGLSHDFLNNKLKIKVLLNNLSNANTNISRSNNGNTYFQSYTNTVGRYFLLSLTWRFDKKFTKF